MPELSTKKYCCFEMDMAPEDGGLFHTMCSNRNRFVLCVPGMDGEYCPK